MSKNCRVLYVSMSPCLYGEKLALVPEAPSPPSQLGRAKFSYNISAYKSSSRPTFLHALDKGV